MFKLLWGTLWWFHQFVCCSRNLLWHHSGLNPVISRTTIMIGNMSSHGDCGWGCLCLGVEFLRCSGSHRYTQLGLVVQSETTIWNGWPYGCNIVVLLWWGLAIHEWWLWNCWKSTLYASCSMGQQWSICHRYIIYGYLWYNIQNLTQPTPNLILPLGTPMKTV